MARSPETRRPVILPARLPRPLHPGAWWLWALGLAVAASRTTNPLILLLIIALAGLTVTLRRTDAPWARAFKIYLGLAMFVVAIRVVFRVVFSGGVGDTELFALPRLALPDWAAGVSVGGAVTAESLLAGFYDGLRLAAILVALGAANALADAKRLLRMVPRALHDIGAALVVAVSLAPQLIESIHRVRKARRLRGGEQGRFRAVRRLLVPILEDAMDRSLSLAASMEARGYGGTPAGAGRSSAAAKLMLAGLAGIALGLYGLLDGDHGALGVPFLMVGLGCAVGGLARGGRHVRTTIYRPLPWRTAEWLVAGSGLITAAGMLLLGASDPALVRPAVDPLAWPQLSMGVGLLVAVAVLPAWVSPPAFRAPFEPRRRVQGDPVR